MSLVDTTSLPSRAPKPPALGMTPKLKSPQLFSSKADDWNTPPEVLARVRRVGPIMLDPCSNEHSVVRAAINVMLPNPAWDAAPLKNMNTDALLIADGLEVDWLEASDGDLVFVNPPYGRALVKWTVKMAYEAARGCAILALIPMRTDTKWFHDHVLTADVMCCWRGRIHFLSNGGASGPATFPSVLPLWTGGDTGRAVRFVEAFADAGWCVEGNGLDR
jgi:hypothetical protein